MPSNFIEYYYYKFRLREDSLLKNGISLLKETEEGVAYHINKPEAEKK